MANDLATMDAPNAAPPTPTIPSQAEAPSLDDRMGRFESTNAERFTEPKPIKRKDAPTPAPAKDAPKQTEAIKPAEVKPDDKAQDKPVEGDVKPAADAPTADAGKPAAKPKPWEMYHNEKKTRETVEKERDTLKAELEQVRKQQPQFDPQEHPEFKKVSERARALEEHIKFVDYTKSSEFQEKYQQPYSAAWTDAIARVKSFQVVGEDGNPRALSEAEFGDLVVNGDDNAVADKLAAWFGTNTIKADRVMALRDKVREAGLSMEKAKNEFRTKGEEREKMTALERQRADKAAQAQAIQRAERFHAMVESALKDDRLKEYFNAADDDAKGKELLTKGFKDADRAFGIGEDGEPPSEDEQLALHAAIRNRAGSWLYLKHRISKLAGERDELAKKLADYEKSEPTSGSPAGAGGGAPSGDDVDSRMLRYQG